MDSDDTVEEAKATVRKVLEDHLGAPLTESYKKWLKNSVATTLSNLVKDPVKEHFGFDFVVDENDPTAVRVVFKNLFSALHFRGITRFDTIGKDSIEIDGNLYEFKNGDIAITLGHPLERIYGTYTIDNKETEE